MGVRTTPQSLKHKKLRYETYEWPFFIIIFYAESINRSLLNSYGRPTVVHVPYKHAVDKKEVQVTDSLPNLTSRIRPWPNFPIGWERPEESG